MPNTMPTLDLKHQPTLALWFFPDWREGGDGDGDAAEGETLSATLPGEGAGAGWQCGGHNGPPGPQVR